MRNVEQGLWSEEERHREPEMEVSFKARLYDRMLSTTGTSDALANLEIQIDRERKESDIKLDRVENHVESQIMMTIIMITGMTSKALDKLGLQPPQGRVSFCVHRTHPVRM